jgi:hypothetical protein
VSNSRNVKLYVKLLFRFFLFLLILVLCLLCLRIVCNKFLLHFDWILRVEQLEKTESDLVFVFLLLPFLAVFFCVVCYCVFPIIMLPFSLPHLLVFYDSIINANKQTLFSFSKLSKVFFIAFIVCFFLTLGSTVMFDARGRMCVKLIERILL